MLKIYKATISTVLRILFGPGCRFTPTCSEYAATAIDKYGYGKGTMMAFKRLSRCHPWTKPQHDPVP